MEHSKVFSMKFSKLYPLYVAKVEKKGRTQAEVDAVISWLTGYDNDGIKAGFITGENICIDGGMTKLMIYHGDHGWEYNGK